MTPTIDTSPEAIAALLDGVTPGPWESECKEDSSHGFDDLLIRGANGKVVVSGCGCCGSPYGENIKDIPFIVAAHELVPALAAKIARLTAAVHELETTVTETETRAQNAIAQMRADRDAALIRAERSERCEVAAHDAANTAIKQRDEARAQVVAALDALREIACFGDRLAGDKLERTGSYAGFDEPCSVETARAALRMIREAEA